MSREYIFREAYFREVWQRLVRHYKSVAIYGAGKHTDWLLHHVVSPEQIESVRVILDDCAPLNGSLQGRPVIATADYVPRPDEVVFVSSDVHERVMAERICKMFPETEIVAPYANTGYGPFELPLTLELDACAKNRAAIASFSRRHIGQRCFILGNGPSLRDTNLSRLSGEITFGLNRIYLMEKLMGFKPSYYVAVNPHVLEQFRDDISNKVQCPKFISSAMAHHFEERDDVMFFDHQSIPTFQTNLLDPLWIGATVTYVAMQIAFYMGFQQVILLGVDHSFTTQGKPHALVESTCADPNHFCADYFGQGIRWQLPDLATSELAYSLARYAYSQNGREILDATLRGHLTIFPKVDYNQLF